MNTNFYDVDSTVIKVADLLLNGKGLLPAYFKTHRILGRDINQFTFACRYFSKTNVLHSVAIASISACALIYIHELRAGERLWKWVPQKPVTSTVCGGNQRVLNTCVLNVVAIVDVLYALVVPVLVSFTFSGHRAFKTFNPLI